MPAMPVLDILGDVLAGALETFTLGTSTLSGGTPAITDVDAYAAADLGAAGSVWFDTSSGVSYLNAGTDVAPDWRAVGSVAVDDVTTFIAAARSLTFSGATVSEAAPGLALVTIDSQIVETIAGDGDIYLAPTASVGGDGNAEISTNAGVGGTGTANVSAESTVGTGNALANMSAGVLTGDGIATAFLSAQVKNPTSGHADSGIRASRGEGGTLVETAVLIEVGAASEVLTIKVGNDTGDPGDVLTRDATGAVWAAPAAAAFAWEDIF